MRRSIRWRLQAWYALVLLGVVGGFAALLYGRVRADRYRQVDAALEGAARYLEVNLRRFPPHVLEDSPPPFPRPGPPHGGDHPRHGPPRFPPPPGREWLMADLDLPKAADPAAGDPLTGAYFAVWREDDRVLKARDLPEGALPRDPPREPLPLRPLLTTRGDYREAVMGGPAGTRILVGRSVAAERAELHAFAWLLAGGGLAALAIGLTGGWLVSARILRPVAAISATASSISAVNLSERIDPGEVDVELAGLAEVLNAMFDRLEAEFQRQARFTADASHELRTPLAILRSHAELALSRPRLPEEYRETLGSCLRAGRRMTGLVEGLLTLARADTGKLDLRQELVDLGGVVEESVTLFRPLAAEKGLKLRARLGSAVVTGDAGRLGQVVTNLLSNAVHYNRPGGEIIVRLGRSDGETVLAVQDTGCGIPEEDRPFVFERFYRVDKARSRASGGNGLGLAICKSIVEAHGGSISFRSEIHRGTTFYVRLC